MPFNSWWTGAELTYALRNAGATVVFVDDERLERIVADGRPERRRRSSACAPTRAADAPFDELCTGTPLADDAIAQLEPDDPVTMLYTSGTTGPAEGSARHEPRPRGQPLEHGVRRRPRGDHRRTATRARRVSRPRSSTGPLFHIGGIAAIIGSPMGGAKIVIMRKWDLERGAAAGATRAITGFGGVPAIARQILEHPGVERPRPRRPRASRWVVPRCRPTSRSSALEVFGETIQILNGYGLTETTSAVVTNVGVEFATHPDSVGRPNLTADVQGRRCRRAHRSASARSASSALPIAAGREGLLERRGGDRRHRSSTAGSTPATSATSTPTASSTSSTA